jgi:hypothetical protein
MRLCQSFRFIDGFALPEDGARVLFGMQTQLRECASASEQGRGLDNVRF